MVNRVEGTIDLLKIDCEGSEWEMFEKSKCWDQVARLAMEYHLFEGQSHDTLKAAISEIGMKLVDQDYDPKADIGMAYAINVSLTSSWFGV